MSPVTHFLVGWVVANSANLTRRERAAVAIAGAVPDIDAFGLFAEISTRDSATPLPWFSDYHHVLAHNLGFGLLVVGVSFLVATQRWKTSALAFLSFHLHLVADVIGGRGVDGYHWPIPYLLPFSNTWQWTWEYQWGFNAWPNFLITGVALAATLFLAWKRGHSPLEMVSASADTVFVGTLRHRFPYPRSRG